LIKILNLDKFSKNLKPVTSPDIFSGSSASENFHPNGVYSELIFGPLESADRMKTFAYINLNAHVIHPVMLNILIRLDRKILNYISTLSYFDINDDGELIEVDDGMTGLSSIISNFSKIKFRGGTPDRERLIQLVNKVYSDGNLFINKIPVIPPFYREIYKDQNNVWVIDELNEIYSSIIRKSLSIKAQSHSTGVLSELLFYGIQKAVNTHHDYIKNKVEKKTGIIRNKLMGKRVDFSAYGVITTEPSIKPNEIGVPLRAAVSLFEPFILYYIMRSGRYSPEFLQEIFNEYKDGFEVSVENLKTILKAIKTDDKISKKLYNFIKEVTEIIAEKRYVIAKRDPVLLPESYQGYKPVIFDGDTIRIHPTKVSGHNADFDGDSVLCDCIIYDEDNNEYKYNIAQLKDSDLFYHDITKEKPNISFYKPTKNLYIDAINTENGYITKKLITDYTEHRNLNLYKISDTKNRFKDFWASDDHSLIVYDSLLDSFYKITPSELKNNPENKYLVQK